MNTHKILLFMVAVLGLLTAVAYSFPRDGVQVSELTLQFPSVDDILGTSEDVVPQAEISPEELRQQRLAKLVASKEDEFLSFMRTNEARIYLPSGDNTYLDPFFAALDSCQEHVVRIVHYGDSQLEEDRMTANLREHFQAQYGGSGPGMMVAIPRTACTYTYNHSITCEDSCTAYTMAYGPSNMRGTHRNYGPMALIGHIDDEASISYSARSPREFPHSQTFQRVRVRTLGRAELTVTAGGGSHALKENSKGRGDGTRLYETVLPKPVSRMTLGVRGEANIQTVQLDGTQGVVIDNVAMRGCSGDIFTTINRSSFEPFFRSENVVLILLQYGSNAVPYLKTEKQIAHFCQSTRQQIEYLHGIAPQARILFLGPPDMATRIKGEVQSYPQLPDIIQALRTTVTEAGAAYWDMCAAMGGAGTMRQWAESKLASNDYLHFLPAGSKQITELLFRTIDFYYKYYRFRHYDRYTMSDSLSAVADSI